MCLPDNITVVVTNANFEIYGILLCRMFLRGAMMPQPTYERGAVKILIFYFCSIRENSCL